MREAAALVIGGMLYSIAFGGYVLLFNEEIICLTRKFMVRNRLSAARKRYREIGALRMHLNRILQTTLDGRVGSSAFLWLCAILFIGVGMVALRSMVVFSAFLTASVAAMTPYFILRIKLEIIRKKSSYEGEAFIGNFLTVYRISNYNIFEAMEKIGKERQKTKNCSELVAKILIGVRSTANHAEINQAANKFAYSINTNWSRIFAYNIRLAIVGGSNISLALEDILIQLREAKAACEDRKRINAESARIVKFFIPALYILSVFMSIKHVGIPIERFIYNQVFTTQGFMLLTMSVFLFIMNLALIEFVNNQQFDY